MNWPNIRAPLDASLGNLDALGAPHRSVLSFSKENMKPMQLSFLGGVFLYALLADICFSQSSVTGIVVDGEGKAIRGARCSVSGFYSAAGSRIMYSGERQFLLTDGQGHFSIPIPRGDPFVDLQFDHGNVPAPAFLYKIKPAASPLRVVLTEGKPLRVRVVERANDRLIPVPHAEIELQMPQEDFWYQNRQATDAKDEYNFRVSAPSGKSPWMLYYAGKRLPVDYAEITPDTVMVLEVSVAMTPSAQVERTNEPSHRTRSLNLTPP